MIFDELRDRYGPYAAELVSQALTLEEFAELELEELVSYFELRAEKIYQEYRTRLDDPSSHNRPEHEVAAYLDVLRRRWQQAEELAHIVLSADMAAGEEEEEALSTGVS